MPSPMRRSTRGAPPTKPPPPPASTASTSSLSSGRQDRNAPTSTAQQKADTPRSLSSEDNSEPPRRSQRAHPAKSSDGGPGLRNGDEPALDEEEEVTRCVCGHQEYPGPPLSEAFTDAELQSEDAGGLFISCDGCSVWQHGGCVGIVEDSQAPDKYYCEECRPKLHELHSDARGQKYSLYLPLHPKPTRKASVSKHGDKGQKELEALAPSRLSADPVTGRRRATMRSKEHDDEEEQLLRAIEESKREVEGAVGGRRSGKRSREESEDNRQDIKRQRTASESLPPLSRGDDSDGEGDSAAVGGRGKKTRADAAQSARQAELREKEKEREKARAEAAGRRQERAGRRRADETELDETPNPGEDSRLSPPLSSQPTSPPPQAAHEKGASKPGPGRRTKKLGNNQYTRHRDALNPAASSPHSRKREMTSNTGVSSGDEQTGNGDISSSANKNSPPHESVAKGRFGKGKGRGGHAANGLRNGAPLDISELSIPEMARQLSAMASFMARAQVDIAGDRTPSNGDSGADTGPTSKAAAPPRSTSTTGANGLQYATTDGRRFEDLTAMEMADVLARNMTFWESKYTATAPASTL